MKLTEQQIAELKEKFIKNCAYVDEYRNDISWDDNPTEVWQWILDNIINPEVESCMSCNTYGEPCKCGENIKKGESKKWDLETLKFAKSLFEFHSDQSTMCNGYRSLCKIIAEEESTTN